MNRVTLSCIALFFMTSTTLFAGGLLTNTNQSIHFNRMFAREGTIGIDGVYSNPAGVAFLSNGFHLSLNNQSAFQTRTIWSGMEVHGLEGTPFHKPFMLNGGDEKGIKKFKGEASAPIIPSVQAAYNTNKWGFQASFAMVGGGGKATFNDGLGSFERTIALIPMALHQLGMSAETPAYSVSSYLHGQQYIFGFQCFKRRKSALYFYRHSFSTPYYRILFRIKILYHTLILFYNSKIIKNQGSRMKLREKIVYFV